MGKRSIVLVSSWREIGVGAVLLAAPVIPVQLLFGGDPEPLGTRIGRCAGIALISLGVSCLPAAAPEPGRAAVRGLLLFNLGTALFLGSLGLFSSPPGMLLWPAAVLHGVIAAALAPPGK